MELEKYSKKFIHYYSPDVPRLLKSLIENNKGLKTIVDLGCGDGSILYSLNKKGLLENFDKIYAVDLSKERLEKVKEINSKINTLVSDVCNLRGFKNSEIDMIISNQVIEHIPDDELMIKEISRILNKNGVIYLSTVFKKWYGWFFYKNKYNRWVIDPTHEIEYMKNNQLLNKLEKYNLDIIENKKSLHLFAITDFFLKRLGFKHTVYENASILKLLRKIKMPILGYYNWEIICKKK